MSAPDAVAFLDRVEADEPFAATLESLMPDVSAVIAEVRSAGFDVTESELRDAALARYGDLLSPEQLQQISAGVDGAAIGIIAGLSAAGVGVGLAVTSAVVGVIV